MRPPPPGWPRLSSAVVYRDAQAMVQWLMAAFGFELRLKIDGEGGRLEHCELTYGEAVVMVARERSATERFGVALKSPLQAGGDTQSLFMYVDDVEAHCQQAQQHGARIVEALRVNDYGEDYWSDRSYAALDPEQHVWFFSQRLRTGGQ